MGNHPNTLDSSERMPSASRAAIAFSLALLATGCTRAQTRPDHPNEITKLATFACNVGENSCFIERESGGFREIQLVQAKKGIVLERERLETALGNFCSGEPESYIKNAVDTVLRSHSGHKEVFCRNKK